MKRTDRKYGGAVYVFTRPGEEWPDLGEDAAAVLLPPDDNDWPPVPDDRDWVEVKSSFGSSLAMSADGSTVVVGAPDNLPHGYDSGAAYVFIRPAGGWGSGAPEVATLTASDGAPNQRFGQAVAVSADGQTIVIGPAGAYVFTRPSGGWTDATEAVKLAIADDPYGSFGTSVAVTGDGAAVFVGAPHAAYVFTRPQAPRGRRPPQPRCSHRRAAHAKRTRTTSAARCLRPTTAVRSSSALRGRTPTEKTKEQPTSLLCLRPDGWTPPKRPR